MSDHDDWIEGALAPTDPAPSEEPVDMPSEYKVEIAEELLRDAQDSIRLALLEITEPGQGIGEHVPGGVIERQTTAALALVRSKEALDHLLRAIRLLEEVDMTTIEDCPI